MPRMPDLIDKVPGRCGGKACIAGTRLYVSLFIGLARMGWDEANTLREYPQVTPEHLDAVWRYYRANPWEIEMEIRANTMDSSFLEREQRMNRGARRTEHRFRLDGDEKPAGKLPSDRIVEIALEMHGEETPDGRRASVSWKDIARFLDERLGREMGR